MSTITPSRPRERPVVLAAAEVRAILDGSMTRLRRVIKPQPACGCRYEINGAESAALHVAGEWGKDIVFVPPTPTSKDHRLPCPFGKPGDLLWVRESWALVCCIEDELDDLGGVIPATKPRLSQVWHRAGHIRERDGREDNGFRWRPPLAMPRWAARLFLRVESVRVERPDASSPWEWVVAFSRIDAPAPKEGE
jgi:hypothetical protein